MRHRTGPLGPLTEIQHAVDLALGYPRLGVDADGNPVLPPDDGHISEAIGVTMTFTGVDPHPTISDLYRYIVVDTNRALVDGKVGVGIAGVSEEHDDSPDWYPPLPVWD